MFFNLNQNAPLHRICHTQWRVTLGFVSKMQCLWSLVWSRYSISDITFIQCKQNLEQCYCDYTRTPRIARSYFKLRIVLLWLYKNTKNCQKLLCCSENATKLGLCWLLKYYLMMLLLCLYNNLGCLLHSCTPGSAWSDSDCFTTYITVLLHPRNVVHIKLYHSAFNHWTC